MATVAFAQQTPQNRIAVPDFSAKKVFFYNTSATLKHTFDLDYSLIGMQAGPNALAFYQDKMFVSFDNGLSNGGVLMYNCKQTFPNSNSTANGNGAPKIIKTNNNAPIAGIQVGNNGDLFVACFNANNQSGHVTRFAAPDYTTATSFDFPITAGLNWWVNYCTGIAIDGAGNVWTGDLDNDRLIVYTAASGYMTYYVINDVAGLSGTDANGMTYPNLHVFSSPEGMAFDAAGNLWIGNNNDWHANNAAGTMVNIHANWIADILNSGLASGTAFSPTISTVDIYYIPMSKLGGMMFVGNTLYMNDQGNGWVWRWDIGTAFTSANFVTSGIPTSYPGYGGVAWAKDGFVSCTATDIEAPQQGQALQVFPNPTQANATLRFTLSTPSQNLAVYLRDITGKTCYEFHAQNLLKGEQNLTLPTEGLTPGFYFCTVKDDNTTFTTSIVKQ